MDAKSFDHVALWVDERLRLEKFIADVSGMHTIERTESFTLLGGDARRGKITLFDGDGPREPWCLHRVTLRVPQIAACRLRLGTLGIPMAESGPGEIRFVAPGGVPFGLVEGPDDVDLQSVVLTVQDPVRAAGELRQMGFRDGDDGLELGGRSVYLRAGRPRPTKRPLLNHLALLVDSAERARREAEELGFEIDRVVDAPNTVAVFVAGPEGIPIEYVEHKPSFSLA